MIWVAIEDADTHEVTEFEQATEKQVVYLMDGYRVDKHDATRFRVVDNVKDVYEGVIYKGGFGYNIWVGSKQIH